MERFTFCKRCGNDTPVYNKYLGEHLDDKLPKMMYCQSCDDIIERLLNSKSIDFDQPKARKDKQKEKEQSNERANKDKQ